MSRLQRIPGLGWYALAGAIFVGALAIAGLLVWRFVAALEPSARFLAPGSFEVAVALPGDYLLWHEHSTIYDGRTFDVAPTMPEGTRYDVQAPGGQRLAVEPYSGMSSEGSAGRSVSVARFDASIAGVYRVAVEGSFEPRVMAVGPNRVWPIVKLAGELFVLIIGALGLAVAVGLYGFLRTVEPPIGATQGGAAHGGAAHGAEPEVPVRKLAGLVYGLQAASMLVGVTLFAAIVINYLRRSQAAGTWLESHFTWQIRTFWWSLAWCVLGVATAVLLVGLLILAASAVWFVYRVVRGWTELNEGRPMYA